MIARSLLIVMLLFSGTASAKICTLVWTESISPDVDGYYVYVDGNKVGETKKLEYELGKCAIGVFTIAAFSKYGIVSPQSIPIGIKEPKTGTKVRLTISEIKGVIEMSPIDD